MGDEDCLRGRAFKWKAAAQCEESDATQRIQIAATVERFPRRLLGAHVMHSAQHKAVGGERRIEIRARDAEVGDDRTPRRPFDENVLGLYVAMHDAPRVRIRQRPRHFAQHANNFRGRQRTAITNTIAKGFAVDVAHREKCKAADFVGAIDGYNVGMRKLRGHARFTQKPFARFRYFSERRRQHLERDLSVEPLIASEYNDAHAASAELSVDGVLTAEGGAQGSEFGRSA